MKKSILTFAVFTLAAAAGAEELRELSFTTAVPCTTAPVLDGNLDDACWKAAPVHSDFYEYIKPNPRRVALRTELRLVYDDRGIYVGIDNFEDHPELVRRAVVKNQQVAIHYDDVNEIHFDPDANGIGFYRWAVNANGKWKCSWRMDSANFHQDWNYGGARAAGKLHKDRWTVEFFVPWDGFHGRSRPAAGSMWTMNVNRYRFRYGDEAKVQPTLLCSSAPGASYCTPQKFGYLYFSDGKAPDADAVASLISARLKTIWGIKVADKVFMHDAEGLHQADLASKRAELSADFTKLDASVGRRVAGLPANANVRGITNDLAKVRTEWAAEQARFDGSFAAIKVLGEKLDALRNVDYAISILELADPAKPAAPVPLPLAGTYDWRKPPKDANGFCGWFRHNFPTNAYVTPHCSWGPVAAKGDVKVLFMTDMGSGVRRALDFTQRFGVEALFDPGHFGVTSIYEDAVSHGTHLDKQRQFETLLAERPDVIFTSGFSWHTAPIRYRYEIYRRVRDEGLGLVILGHPGTLDEPFRQLPADEAVRTRLASAAPLAELEGVYVRPRPRPGLTASEQLVTPRHYGKGRVVSLGLSNPPAWSLNWKSAWESQFVMWRNAIDWAANRTRAVRFDFGSGEERDRFGMRANYLTFRATSAEKGARVTARVRNAENDVLSVREYELAAGENVFSVDVGAAFPGGDYYLDVYATVGGRQDAAAVHPFTKASVAGTLVIDGTNRSVVAENQAKTLRVDWMVGVPRETALEWTLADLPYGQVRRVGRVPVRPNQRNAFVSLPREPFPTLAATLEAVLVDADGARLGRAKKVVHFPNHRFEDYTLISWSTMDCYATPPEELYPTLVDDFGYRNQLGGIGSWWLSIFNCRHVPYSCRVSLGNGPNGPVWGVPGCGRGKDFEKLTKEVGGWSPYNPAARKMIEEKFGKVVSHAAPYGVSVWSFGDECGYGNDLGFGGATDAADFAAFLKQRYGTVARYNRAHGTSIADFSEARHLKVKEAAAAHDWASWFDNVQFSEKMYADTYYLLQSIVRKQDPLGRCGAEGSAGGDLEYTVKDLKFWGPYRSLVNDELLRNLAPNHVRGIWWGGYVNGSLRDGYPVGQWEYVLTGTCNADQWFTIAPGQAESGISGDLQLAPYVKLYLPHLKELRRGLAQLMIHVPMRPDPVALYYSHPSERIASQDDACPPPSDALADLIRFCYLHGFDVKMVTPRTLAKLQGCKALFLASDTALGDAEVAALEKFAKGGGRLASNVSNLGIYDEFLGRREKPVLEGLYEKFDDYKDDAKLLAFLAQAKVTPREEVTGLPPGDVILRVRELRDMKVVGLKTHTKNRGRDVTIDLKGEGHVYEALKGYVGCLSKIEMKPMGVPFRLFSVFPEKQSAPAFETAAALTAGEFATYATKDLRQGSTYRLEVFDPDGKALAWREEIFKADAKREPTRRIQFPFSDRKGAWKLALTDVATGLKSERTVEVR